MATETEAFADDGTMLKDLAQFDLAQEMKGSEPMGHFARTLVILGHGVMRGLDTEVMRGAGICAEWERSGDQPVQGPVDRDLDAG